MGLVWCYRHFRSLSCFFLLPTLAFLREVSKQQLSWRSSSFCSLACALLFLLHAGRVSVAIRRLVHLSWYEPAVEGLAISCEAGTRSTGFSYVYKYQLTTQVE